MAWRSSGTTNDEMVENMKRYDVISSVSLEQGFRNVDRRLFVPEGHERVSYTDQPLKEGNVHISAPHIYGAALEALELVPNSSMSFLNIGSGTGYVSCIVADIMGSRSSHYGIEIHADVVQHSKTAIAEWKRSTVSSSNPSIQILHGNGLDVICDKGESMIGFDRIYVGAAVERRNLNKLTRLLRLGGILVGPVDDELVKVVMINRDDEHFTQQTLSGVRFAPLLSFPKMETVIPSNVWDPSIHNFYPDSFRASCKELLLCNNSDTVQPRHQVPQINLAAMLPKVLWMEIISFTHRNWFEPELTETAFLRRQLLEEQAEAKRANQARLEVEARCHALEHERDMYRLLASRWQSRLRDLLRRNNSSENQVEIQVDMEAALDAILNQNRTNDGLFVGSMLRRFQNEDEEDQNVFDSEMEEDDDEILAEEQSQNDGEESIDADIASDDENVGQSFDSATTMDEDDDTPMSSSPTSKPFVSREVRTVSISSDDL